MPINRLRPDHPPPGYIFGQVGGKASDSAAWMEHVRIRDL